MTHRLLAIQTLEHEISAPSAILGTSTPIVRLRACISRFAPTEATLLVRGESGAGKELVAREVHRLSSRSDGELVIARCAALTAELFSGDGEGPLTAARGGTLVFDEVSELPPIVQAELVRFFDHGAAFDVRIVATTSRDLRRETTEKRFREDLFYRLQTVPITVCPLRERREDVPILADRFLARAAARYAIAAPRISPQARAALLAHDWPGNVRELANVMEAAVILCRGDVLEREQLPELGLTAHVLDG